MNYEILAQIIFFGSLLGMGIILYRKIPEIAKLPEKEWQFGLKDFLLKLKGKIKTSRYFKIPPFEIFLQKILSKIRIFALKIENKTLFWQKKLREKSKKIKENKDFLKKLKNSMK